MNPINQIDRIDSPYNEYNYYYQIAKMIRDYDLANINYYVRDTFNVRQFYKAKENIDAIKELQFEKIERSLLYIALNKYGETTISNWWGNAIVKSGWITILYGIMYGAVKLIGF
jgi:hypothetical protein